MMQCDGLCIKDQTYQEVINVTYWLDEVDELVKNDRLPFEKKLHSKYFQHQLNRLKYLRRHSNSAIKRHLCHLTQLPWPVVSTLSTSLVGAKCFRFPSKCTKLNTFPQFWVSRVNFKMLQNFETLDVEKIAESLIKS